MSKRFIVDVDDESARKIDEYGLTPAADGGEWLTTGKVGTDSFGHIKVCHVSHFDTSQQVDAELADMLSVAFIGLSCVGAYVIGQWAWRKCNELKRSWQARQALKHLDGEHDMRYQDNSDATVSKLTAEHVMLKA